MSAQIELVRLGVDLGILVKNEEAMVRFYRDGIGFLLVEDLVMDADPPFAGRRLRVFGLGDAVLKLWTLPSTEGIVDPEPDRYGQLGIRYVTIFLKDVDAILARLTGLGFEITEPPKRSEAGSPATLTFVCDPDGNFLEFVEMDDPDARLPNRGE